MQREADGKQGRVRAQLSDPGVGSSIYSTIAFFSIIRQLIACLDVISAFACVTMIYFQAGWA